MDRFTSEFFTAYWWLSVVLAGIVINIASAYLKDRVDRLGTHLLKPVGRMTARRRRAFNDLVAHLKARPGAIDLAMHHATHRYLHSAGNYVFALVQFLTSGALWAVLSDGGPIWLKVACAVTASFSLYGLVKGFRQYAEAAQFRNAAMVAGGMVADPGSKEQPSPATAPAPP